MPTRVFRWLPKRTQIGSKTASKNDRNKDEILEESLDPRWELVEKLVEYKRFKTIAQEIEQLISKANDYYSRDFVNKTTNDSTTEIKSVNRVELWNTFNAVLRRLSSRIEEGQINEESVTVTERMNYIINYMKSTTSFYFSNLFENKTTLSNIVATFLAILELTRLEEIKIEQNIEFSDILCQKNN